LIGVFGFLLDRNRSNGMRLRLIRSALVVTAPLNHERGGEITPFYRVLWQLTAITVFAIPVVVTVLMIANQTNAVATFFRRVPGEQFLKDPSGPFLAQLTFEGVCLLLQLDLLIKLIGLANRFGRDQGEVGCLIAAFERQGSQHEV
jgi:hypothetical protein